MLRRERHVVESERDLVIRIRAGDASAFETLYADFASALLGFAYTQVRSRAVAEDLVQELFLNIWRHREHWVLTRSLRSYLFTALRNLITDWRRATTARPELEPDPIASAEAIDALASSEATDDRVREADLLRAYARAIDALPRKRRETFLLIRQQKLSYAEAAEVLGVTVKAVEVNMGRAFQDLRRNLVDWFI